MASLVHTFLVKLVATFIGPEIAILFAMFTNNWQVWFFFVNKDGCWYCFRVFQKCRSLILVVRRTKLTNQTTTLRQLDDNCFIFECSKSRCYVCGCLSQATRDASAADVSLSGRKCFATWPESTHQTNLYGVPCREFLLRQFAEYKATAVMRRWKNYRE